MRPFEELPPESQAEIRQFEEYLKLRSEARRLCVPMPKYEEWRELRRRHASEGGTMKLTTDLRRLIVRVEEEIEAQRQGEPTANPQQAFDELVLAVRADLPDTQVDGSISAHHPNKEHS